MEGFYLKQHAVITEGWMFFQDVEDKEM